MGKEEDGQCWEGRGGPMMGREKKASDGKGEEDGQ